MRKPRKPNRPRGPRPAITAAQIAQLGVAAAHWDLPITFTLNGDEISGELSLGVRCNLNKMSIDDAKRAIAASMKAAILSRIRFEK